jgi:hypothetical protein
MSAKIQIRTTQLQYLNLKNTLNDVLDYKTTSYNFELQLKT